MAKKNSKEDKGMSLDDAFADDDDVEYAKAKPRKSAVKEVEKKDFSDEDKITVKWSKPISQIKKGDKIKVDNLVLEVDAHVVLIDHGNGTREMAVECFDSKNDKDYQIRYFSDQVETSIEVYSLEEIVYSRMKVKKVEW